MRHYGKYWLAVLVALSLLYPAAGRAQGLTFTFTNPAALGPPGSIIRFNGTVTNTSGTTLYLTFDNLNFTPSSVATADDSVFFDNVTASYLNGDPVSLANDTSVALPVFDVTLSPSAPYGSVASGLFSVQADTSADPNSPGQPFTTADISFSATVAPVPEPRVGGVFGVGTALLLLYGLRRRFCERT